MRRDGAGAGDFNRPPRRVRGPVSARKFGMTHNFLAGKVALVTGSTDGIGKETARELARGGAKVLLHGRDREKGESAAFEIRQSVPGADLDLIIADFSSLRQVEQMAEEIQRTYPELQILINNAGTYAARRTITGDGFEVTFQVQYLAPFVLTQALLDLLPKNRPSRIVNVTSILHKGAALDFRNLRGERGYDGHAAYATSKLALTLFSFELARRLDQTGVTVNCVHPGAVDTRLMRAGLGTQGMSPAEGARAPLFLASAMELEGVSGAYFELMKAADPDPRANDAALRDALWERTELLLRRKPLRPAA